MRKRMVRVGAGWFLCCVWSMCTAATQAGPQIIFEGSAHTFSPVRTSGSGVPLLDALERIVPSSYSVNMPNAGTWAEMPVNWRPGAFVTVLGQVLAQDATLQARVNTDLQLVTVSKKAVASGDAIPLQKLAPSSTSLPAGEQGEAHAAKAPAMVSVAMHETNRTLPLAGSPATVDAAGVFMRVESQASPDTSADVSPSPAAPMRTTWQLTRADGSIRNALSRWASESGWQFVWDVPTDFSIDAAATLHGTLEDALNAVVNALSTSQVPIQIVMYKGNRVLRVVAKGAG